VSARRGVRFRRCAGKIEHCAATSEHATRSGGRQPAVVGETLMQRRSFPTAGLRQPLLTGRRTFTAKRVICDAQTHVPKSGGRQPAVSLGNASATGDGFVVIGGRDSQERRASARRGRRNAHATAFVSHGWLTPAAPDRTTNIHCKVRACRCTNACAQERRASARRGRRNTHATAFVSHGWLTPAAPDRATNIHCKARAWRRTNARAQERRA
jgi:hypothetical protein